MSHFEDSFERDAKGVFGTETKTFGEEIREMLFGKDNSWKPPIVSSTKKKRKKYQRGRRTARPRTWMKLMAIVLAIVVLILPQLF